MAVENFAEEVVVPVRVVRHKNSHNHQDNAVEVLVLVTLRQLHLEVQVPQAME